MGWKMRCGCFRIGVGEVLTEGGKVKIVEARQCSAVRWKSGSL